jgi:hypothetical protein
MTQPTIKQLRLLSLRLTQASLNSMAGRTGEGYMTMEKIEALLDQMDQDEKADLNRLALTNK